MKIINIKFTLILFAVFFAPVFFNQYIQSNNVGFSTLAAGTVAFIATLYGCISRLVYVKLNEKDIAKVFSFIAAIITFILLFIAHGVIFGV